MDNELYIHSDLSCEEYLRFKINYLKKHTEEELIEAEREYWTKFLDASEQKLGKETSREYRESFIELQTSITLNDKIFFERMSNELIEKYIKRESIAKAFTKEISKYTYPNPKSVEIEEAVNNVSYLIYKDYSLKQDIKDRIQLLIDERQHYVILSLAGMAGVLGSLYPTERMQLATTSFAISFAFLTTVLGSNWVTSWQEKIKSNPHDIELLKQLELYELLLESISAEKEYENAKKKTKSKKR